MNSAPGAHSPRRSGQAVFAAFLLIAMAGPLPIAVVGQHESPNIDGQGVALVAIQALVVEIQQPKDQQIALLKDGLAQVEQLQARNTHNQGVETRLAALERLFLNDQGLAEAP